MMPFMPTVLITNAVPPAHIAPLDGIAKVILGSESAAPMARESVLEIASTLDAIINQAELRVDAELLDRCPRLRIIANVSIGHDNLDLKLMSERGVWATNVPNVFSESAADCAMGLLLCVARR